MGSEKSRRRKEDTPADVDALSIKKKPSDYARPLLVVVILFAVGLGLLTCVVGGVVLGVIAANNESTAAKLPGSWTGQFNILGQQVNTVYTFKKDGTFREESVDGLGNRQVADGRWRVKNGEVHIDWNQGGFEVATVHFLNQNTMDYRIINHNQLAQIGIGTTFKRR